MNIKNQFDKLNTNLEKILSKLEELDKTQEKRFKDIIKEVKASGQRKDKSTN